MQRFEELRSDLPSEAVALIDLYRSLGEGAESLIPGHIWERLIYLNHLCSQESIDPVRQQFEIDRCVLDLQESITAYRDVSLMIFPHEDSRAFIYTTQKNRFTNRISTMMDKALIDDSTRKDLQQIVELHDFSIGTPPITQADIDFRYQILLGERISELKKFRDVIGIGNDIEKAQWDYLLDIFEQMVIQSTHYTSGKERQAFLELTRSSVNYKGLDGLIRTVVSGSTDSAAGLIAGEVFDASEVRQIEYKDEETLYQQMILDNTSIFVVKIKQMRHNIFNKKRWFPLLSRLVFLDNSDAAEASNTTLVFSFHNQIIHALNKVHNKKLGAPASNQLNLRLIIEKIGKPQLQLIESRLKKKVSAYEEELRGIKK